MEDSRALEDRLAEFGALKAAAEQRRAELLDQVLSKSGGRIFRTQPRLLGGGGVVCPTFRSAKVLPSFLPTVSFCLSPLPWPFQELFFCESGGSNRFPQNNWQYFFKMLPRSWRGVGELAPLLGFQLVQFYFCQLLYPGFLPPLTTREAFFERVGRSMPRKTYRPVSKQPRSWVAAQLRNHFRDPPPHPLLFKPPQIVWPLVHDSVGKSVPQGGSLFGM